MSRKIQFHTFHLLFRLFSYLADKSGGWSMFVRPKLVMGGVIVGLGMTACDTKTEKNAARKSDLIKIESSKNQTLKKDSTRQESKVINHKGSKDKFIEPQPTCYDIDYHEVECYAVAPPGNPNSDSIFNSAEQMPMFTGGDSALTSYLSKNTIYPPQAVLDKIEGRVVCRFVVNKDGSISDVIVLRGAHPLLDPEAVRVIQSFPYWIPGKHKGKPVRVYYILPIKFAL